MELATNAARVPRVTVGMELSVMVRERTPHLNLKGLGEYGADPAVSRCFTSSLATHIISNPNRQLYFRLNTEFKTL